MIGLPSVAILCFAQNDPDKYNRLMVNVKRLGVHVLPHRLVAIQTVLLILAAFVVFTAQASAVIRFNDRSLNIANSEPGIATSYKITFTYNNQGVYTTTVGSIDMLFCLDPIPSERISAQNPVDHHPCVPPAGINVSNAVLTAQTGETGFTVHTLPTSDPTHTYHLVLTRTPGAVSETPSTYTLGNIINPTQTDESFAIRMSDYASTDTSGPLINLGSIVTQANPGVFLETQVPPMLIFCMGAQVSLNCTSVSGGWYTDMGTLDANNTLKATSQMAAGTNASGGYVITVNGPTMAAGTNFIQPLMSPTVSTPGNSQFGLNLRANSDPNLGSDPDGDFTNATPMPNYDTPNEFTYKDGDVVAGAPNVSLMRRFTVSYVVNSPQNLRPGVYTTTVTYICSGRF